MSHAIIAIGRFSRYMHAENFFENDQAAKRLRTSASTSSSAWLISGPQVGCVGVGGGGGACRGVGAAGVSEPAAVSAPAALPDDLGFSGTTTCTFTLAMRQFCATVRIVSVTSPAVSGAVHSPTPSVLSASSVPPSL